MSGRSKMAVRHFGLLRMFVFVMFTAGLVNSAMTALAVYALVHAGVLQFSAQVLPGLGRLMLIFMLFSIPVSLLVAALSSKFPLKPVRDLISGMNRLASGNFQTRVNAGRIMRRHPAYVEMAESFNNLAQELEHTQMLRSDFVNNFSHEFKTPIVSIAGFAQLLRHGDVPPEQQREYLQIIEEESMRLSHMATNVLSLTRVENQSILTDVTAFNLSEQIRSCMLLLESEWSRRELELQLDFDEFTIHASEELLRQVWINLLDNAVKFTPEGGRIRVDMAPVGQQLEVTVANTGPEIPQACLDRIFDKFYQVDTSHSTRGNGVGLAIVRRVVQLHGGHVRVRSGAGETAFTVCLPL